MTRSSNILCTTSANITFDLFLWQNTKSYISLLRKSLPFLGRPYMDGCNSKMFLSKVLRIKKKNLRGPKFVQLKFYIKLLLRTRFYYKILKSGRIFYTHYRCPRRKKKSKRTNLLCPVIYKSFYRGRLWA